MSLKGVGGGAEVWPAQPHKIQPGDAESRLLSEH